MHADSKATLPSPPTAPPKGPSRRLLGKKAMVNAAAILTGLVAAAVAYAALATIVGVGLGAGALHQADSVRSATGLILSSRDFVPPIGSTASFLLAAITLSVPVGALACGLAAYRSTKRWLAARFTMEG